MPAGSRYDTIGRSYARARMEEPVVADVIHRGLGGARSVCNVGAGTGNYEPRDRLVVSVEPSPKMIGQRPDGSAPVVRGIAEALPFETGTFDAAMALLTMHHWSDPAAGVREMARVSSTQVVFFFEPLRTRSFWGLDYFPETLDLPTEIDPPGEELLRSLLDVRSVERVLVPRDCRDGFAAAYWARPERYLEAEVQGGMSWLALLPEPTRVRGTERLRADLESGVWDERYGHLRDQELFDGGLRLAVAVDPGQASDLGRCSTSAEPRRPTR